MKLIVGLGNPGHTYHDTRHNVGFRVIQLLAEQHGVEMAHRLVSAQDQRPAGVYGEYEHSRQRVRLLMPLTMMNESGQALTANSADPAQLLVVCDDVNLPLGAIRLRPQGGAGGHHGLQSCLDALGTLEVNRLRVGVGTDPLPRDLEAFVLARFQRAECAVIQRAIEQAADACEVWVSDGLETAMNRYNRTQDAE